MGSNIGKDQELISIVTQVVKEVARVPVWAKLTPSTTDIVVEARGAFLGGADAIVSSNTFPSLPLIDPETLEFEMNVDGYVSSGGLGGPAILPQSIAKMAQLTQAFPDKAFSGIGGVSDFAQALNYFLLGCGTVQVCTAAMLDHAIGPNVIKTLRDGMTAFLERHADKRLDVARGLPRHPPRSRRHALADQAARHQGVLRRARAPKATRSRSRRADDRPGAGLRRARRGRLGEPALEPRPRARRRSTQRHLVHLPHRRALDRHERWSSRPTRSPPG